MIRHFYISNDLDDLETLENDLESRNISRAQIHILSNNDAGLEQHHLHQVPSPLKKDIVHTTKIGFLVGLAVSGTILLTAYLIGMAESFYWVPVIFLAIIALGFCTWEGGLIGIHKPHHEYKKFEKVLEHGKHVLIIDAPLDQEDLIKEVLQQHPRVKAAGLGEPVPDWLVGIQKQWYRFVRWAP